MVKNAAAASAAVASAATAASAAKGSSLPAPGAVAQARTYPEVHVRSSQDVSLFSHSDYKSPCPLHLLARVATRWHQGLFRNSISEWRH